ncbi:hypothetical protein NQD34_017071 [Periophthalmus magnuspinnatus]|nr:hypothetical protein NQD34_017071 [Periophthalmus magnuspinnatus]
MGAVRVVQLAVLAWLASAIASHEDSVQYLVTAPQKPELQIGTNFTATCFIKNTTEVTADDLRWKDAKGEIPPEQYTKISETALNVTITVTNETSRWLFCFIPKNSEHVKIDRWKYYHGINLKKGYLPKKPENLTCKAVQYKMSISQFLHCEWEPKHQQPGDFSTFYKLNVHVLNTEKVFNKTTTESSVDIDTETFPSFMTLEIWVEAENTLGKVESEHLRMEANSFIKTDPPSNINIISEDSFPTSLLLNWTRPIDKTHVYLIYEIRFAPNGSHTWSHVPQADTNIDIQSFRLQNLQPNTVYITQVRCKNERDGYWSEWSNNSTKRTPSSSKDHFRGVFHQSCLTSLDLSKIMHKLKLAPSPAPQYQISIQDSKEKLPNKNMWEKIRVTNPNADSSTKHATSLKEIDLREKRYRIVKVTAVNVKGTSPVATIVIPEKENVLFVSSVCVNAVPPPVQKLEVYPDAGKLCVEWTTPNSTAVSEYVVQWTRAGKMNWQREKKGIRKTSVRGMLIVLFNVMQLFIIKMLIIYFILVFLGNLEEFVRYNVSVYPLYSGWIGKPLHVETYFEQGAPIKGPSVKLNGKPGSTEVHLVWEEISLDEQRGFISNYTIFYSDGTKTEAITVSRDTLSYTLKPLTRNTRYDTWIRVSNVKGFADGNNHTFTTVKYAPGEIEGIVVGVSLCFLFVVVLTMLICICKRDVIKESFWPQIPNPGASTIGTWSPDYHIKAETSSENCLSGISALDVDICDGKSVFEEDKACLPLKKDKYMSEEHSSGIGGSSCMSSPRQSVSDSDEGGDIADTTASTVQYSSVVASSGYKGQTPSLPSQQAVFSRSESTQPLLESEENPDMLSLEGSRQSQRFPPESLSHCEGNSDNPNQVEIEAKTLDFCPVGDDSEDRQSDDAQSHEWSTTAPISSYMPQLGGYRPQ